MYSGKICSRGKEQPRSKRKGQTRPVTTQRQRSLELLRTNPTKLFLYKACSCYIVLSIQVAAEAVLVHTKAGPRRYALRYGKRREALKRVHLVVRGPLPRERPQFNANSTQLPTERPKQYHQVFLKLLKWERPTHIEAMAQRSQRGARAWGSV